MLIVGGCVDIAYFTDHCEEPSQVGIEPQLGLPWAVCAMAAGVSLNLNRSHCIPPQTGCVPAQCYRPKHHRVSAVGH